MLNFFINIWKKNIDEYNKIYQYSKKYEILSEIPFFEIFMDFDENGIWRYDNPVESYEYLSTISVSI